MSQSDDISDNFDLEGVCQPGNENTGRWTSDEHRLFLKGLELHGKGWKQIATLIQTRTVVQIRTHAQKYFQKLTKAQASGTSHLDPATLMSTMDAGKPRPATVARNLRSSTIAHCAADSEGRLRSLPKRHNRGRNSRIEHDQYSDDTSGDDSKNSNRRRRSSSSTSGRSSSGGSGSSANSRDGLSSEEDDDEEERHQKQEIMPGVYRDTDHAAEGNEEGATEDEVAGNSTDHAEDHTDDEAHSFSPSHHVGGKGGGDSGSGGWNRRPATKHIGRSSPAKASKAALAAAAREGGAADARALAWEAAAAKAEAATAAAAVVTATGSKRNRTENSTSSRLAPSHDLAVSGSIEGLKRTGGPQGTRISPTSVSDINFMSFPVPQIDQSDIAMHQLPQQLAPSWCTKPQDSWTSVAGFDIGGDSDDAGPFRWFIDERSLSAPGAFFQPPAEAWGGSDTTDASTSGGVSSGGECIEGACRAVVHDISVSTNKVEASPRGSNGASYVDAVSTDDAADSHPAKRRRVEPTVTIDAARLRCLSHAAPVCDAAMATEVNRHVDADAENGLDITSGLWLDHPQEATSLMCGLGLSAPSVAGPGGSLSLPSLDEDEVLGFLACEENRAAENLGML